MQGQECVAELRFGIKRKGKASMTETIQAQQSQAGALLPWEVGLYSTEVKDHKANPPVSRPTNKSDVWEWLKRMVSVLVVLGGLYGVLRYVISSEISKQVGPLRQDFQTDIGTLRQDLVKLQTRMDDVEKREDRLEARALPAMLKSSLPKQAEELKSSLQEKKEIAEAATRRGILVDPAIVADLGRKVIHLPQERPELADAARKTAVALLQYRSFLNGASASVPRGLSTVAGGNSGWNYSSIDKRGPVLLLEACSNGTPTSPSRTWRYVMRAPMAIDHVPRGPAWEGAFKLDETHIVSLDQAAVLERIGDNLNASEKVAPRYLMLKDIPIALVLDGMRIKNVIFMNCEVAYSGSAIQMEGVYFVNCRFSVSPNARGDLFISKSLVSTPSDFTASS